MRYSDLLSMMVCSLSSRILSPGTVHRTHSILLGNFLTSIGATAMISKIYGFVLPVAVVHIVLFHAKGKPKEYPTNGPYHCWFYPCWVYGYYRYLMVLGTVRRWHRWSHKRNLKKMRGSPTASSRSDPKMQIVWFGRHGSLCRPCGLAPVPLAIKYHVHIRSFRFISCTVVVPDCPSLSTSRISRGTTVHLV